MKWIAYLALGLALGACGISDKYAGEGDAHALDLDAFLQMTTRL